MTRKNFFRNPLFFRIHGLYGDGYFMFFNGGCISSSTRYSREKVCTLIYSRLNLLYFFVLTSIWTEKAFQGMSKNTIIPYGFHEPKEKFSKLFMVRVLTGPKQNFNFIDKKFFKSFLPESRRFFTQ